MDFFRICVGTALMRSAGCAIYGWADRDFDKNVKRTVQSPLTTGAIKPKEAVWVFVVLSLAAALLLIGLNQLT
jgi:4-hydroxybenzoate polyprenyltransferase